MRGARYASATISSARRRAAGAIRWLGKPEKPSPHGDAGPRRRGLDGKIAPVWGQVGDEVHALVGDRHRQLPGAVAQQGCRERVALFAVELAHAPDVRCEVPLLHERGDDRGGGGRRLPVEQVAGGEERRNQGVRHHGVTEPQAGEQRLVERADVDDALLRVEALEGGERRAPVAELARIVVLDDECAAVARPAEQRQAPRHRQCHAGWELMRGRDEGGARPRRLAEPGGDDHPLAVDGHRMRPHLGQQQLRQRQRVAGILDPDLIARCQQHADGDVEGLLGTGQ
jgi:hypothetical protein